jgi:phosphoglycolate phosphatase
VPTRLVLWDIDRTLVDTNVVGREIYAEAFAAVLGRELERLPDMAGRTDHSIVLASLRDHGVPAPETYLDAFYAALAGATRARRADMARLGRCLPGARAALAAFAALGVVQTVVTGNVEPAARVKLEAFDLAGAIDFGIGGYGSDDADRAHLVRLALERASRAYPAGSPACVVGDTPHDIAGAVANGIRSVGVATGRFAVDELLRAGADAVLPSLADTDALVRLVLG